MLNAIVETLAAVFAVAGLTEFIQYGVFWLFRPERREEAAILLRLEGQEEDAEFRLRAALEDLKWFRGKGNKSVICIDCGMDEETRTICLKMQERYPAIRIVSGFANGEGMYYTDTK